MDDVRTSKRFPVQLPIKVSGSTQNDQFNGTADNVSAAGAYLRIDSPLEVGTSLTFRMRIPADQIGAKQDVTVVCSARVMRADHKDGQNGVACVIDNYEFVREEGE